MVTVKMGEKRDNYSIYLKMLKEHFLNVIFDLGKKTSIPESLGEKKKNQCYSTFSFRSFKIRCGGKTSPKYGYKTAAKSKRLHS